MKTILVTGCNGLLGQKTVLSGSKDNNIIGVDLHKSPIISDLRYHRLDITDKDRTMSFVEQISPDCVINTAALTDVDLCETRPDLAWKINVEGLINVSEACLRTGSKLIQISSDYVFDGKYGPYDEDAPPNPINHYGRTKLESEKVALSSSPDNNIVVRTMVLYGYAPGVRPNFVLWLINALQQGTQVRIVTDQWGNPTFADDLAGLLIRLGTSDLSGLFHLAGGDLLSRFQMAQLIADAFGLDKGLIKPVITVQLDQTAPRPLKSGLKTGKIERALGVKPLKFKEGLERLAGQMGQLSPNPT
nr:dTDP-4-dehydrorhamnose reductase [Desulfobacterales bacterium]